MRIQKNWGASRSRWVPPLVSFKLAYKASWQKWYVPHIFFSRSHIVMNQLSCSSGEKPTRVVGPNWSQLAYLHPLEEFEPSHIFSLQIAWFQAGYFNFPDVEYRIVTEVTNNSLDLLVIQSTDNGICSWYPTKVSSLKPSRHRYSTPKKKIECSCILHLVGFSVSIFFGDIYIYNNIGFWCTNQPRAVGGKGLQLWNRGPKISQVFHRGWDWCFSFCFTSPNSKGRGDHLQQIWLWNGDVKDVRKPNPQELGQSQPLCITKMHNGKGGGIHDTF